MSDHTALRALADLLCALGSDGDLPEVARLREAIAALAPPADVWLGIASAPEAERIQIFVPNLGVKVALKTTHPSDGAVWWDGEERIYNPTHWMPLPKWPDRAAAAPAPIKLCERHRDLALACSQCRPAVAAPAPEGLTWVKQQG